MDVIKKTWMNLHCWKQANLSQQPGQVNFNRKLVCNRCTHTSTQTLSIHRNDRRKYFTHIRTLKLCWLLLCRLNSVSSKYLLVGIKWNWNVIYYMQSRNPIVLSCKGWQRERKRERMGVNAKYFKLLTHSQLALDTIDRNFINCTQITLKMNISNRHCV